MAEKYDDHEIRFWSETVLNYHCREAMMRQGLRALHVKEANEAGVSDLIVSQYVNGNLLTGQPFKAQEILAWLELKIGWNGQSVRVPQRDFMRQQWREGRNSWFAALNKIGEPVTIDFYRGDTGSGLGEPVLQVRADPYRVDWKAEVFQPLHCVAYRNN